jgi:hypothetical protein
VKRVRVRVLFWITAALLVAILAGSILLLRSTGLPKRYKTVIEAQLKEATGRDVWIRRASLRFLGGLGIEFEDLVIKDWDGQSDFIRTKGLILQMRLLPLLRRQLRWKALILERPSFWLRRSREGGFNLWAKGTPQGGGEYPPIASLLSSFTGGEIRVRRGSVHFVDALVTSAFSPVAIENLYIELRSISLDAPITFEARARQPNPTGPSGRLVVTGELGPLSNPLEPTKIPITAEVRAKNLNPLPFWPYYGPSLPMKRIGGLADIHGRYEGDFSGQFQSRGRITVRNADVDYPQVFDTVLKPQEFVVDYDVKVNRRSLIVSHVSFRLPEIEIRGRCALTEISSPSRRIEAFAVTSSFQFGAIDKYIPYRILSPDLAEVMREVTRGGKGKIVSLRIEGFIRDFSMLEDPSNADLIYGRIRLDGMTFSFSEDFHPIERISGWAILEKGSLRFQDLRGSYRRSRVSAPEVIVSRIYSSSPQLNLALRGQVDVEGAGDIAKPGAFTGKESPIGDISGRGDLELTVLGDLSDTSGLRYNGHLVPHRAEVSIKVVRMPFSVRSGSVDFSNDRIRLVDLTGEVGSSTIRVNGKLGNPWLGKPGGDQVNLSLRGEMNLRECLYRILPGIAPRVSQVMTQFSEVSGRATINLELAGRGSRFEKMSYRGRVSLGRAVLRGHRMVSPVRFVKGYIDFTEQLIRLSGVEARLNKSYLRIEGSIRGYLHWERSEIDLRVRAPRLDLGDFELKKGEKGGKMWRGRMPLPGCGRMALVVEEGRWRFTDFSNLTARITLAKGRLDVERFHFDVKEGRVDLKAWLDLGNEGGVAFAVHPNVSQVDAGRFFKDFALQERVWITGAFNLWGSLMGRGRTEEEVRRDLEGELKVRMEKGRIRRFRILSKVFSLLNISQLFKGKLPELTGEGLPYNSITGEITVAKGIARTDNLLVDSDAMKISIIGEADIAREVLDFTVGLHPMGTVDTIVSKVPVVGRILAGEDESVISYYVKVTGDFANPKVKHIPLRAMEKGLVEMIRRLLETPMHIIPKGKGPTSSGSSDAKGEHEVDESH